MFVGLHKPSTFQNVAFAWKGRPPCHCLAAAGIGGGGGTETHRSSMHTQFT